MRYNPKCHRHLNTLRNALYVSIAMICMALTGKPMMAAPAVAEDVIEIENLQGRYLHCMNSNRLDLIPTFFAQHDPGVTLDLPTGAVSGLAAIRNEFHGLQAMVTAQDGFMGTHLATTPVVKVCRDGKTAKGSWMSYGFTVMGPAFVPGPGSLTPPYPTMPVIGRYSHTFVKEAGVWKFKNFKWSIFVSLPPFAFDLPSTGPGWANLPLVPGTKEQAGQDPWPLDPIDQ